MKDGYLTEGDVIELGAGHRVYAQIPKHFVYANRRGDFTLTRHDIDLGDDEWDYLRGRYVVYRTEYSGGGTGHGPHDIYPDGHHVCCERVDDRNVKVDFYQSGSFTATIPSGSIEPVGLATREWCYEDE